ncbi:hypothetical protein ALC62_10466 [Cyphomyrmex costatus]|uniref:Endonuclease/exonuclease/phosphatase domain-containing protein n=1 Tax=Cyphomyrmex costatus TaxID=456900 RepID=A0A151IDN4_9HYME|nr:hypothetical protein ALC62_10466 [Cyphomyrmex costatus]
MNKVLQWNCKGILGKFNELSNSISEYDIVCLQETWLKPDHRIGFTGYKTIRSDRCGMRSGGGTAVICRNGLDPLQVGHVPKFFHGVEMTAVSVKIREILVDRILIVSLYKPPEVSLDRQQWLDLFEILGIGFLIL